MCDVCVLHAGFRQVDRYFSALVWAVWEHRRDSAVVARRFQTVSGGQNFGLTDPPRHPIDGFCDPYRVGGDEDRTEDLEYLDRLL